MRNLFSTSKCLIGVQDLLDDVTHGHVLWQQWTLGLNFLASDPSSMRGIE